MSETIEEAAARWYAAQDSDAMDWDGFTLWLEADPRHRAAFDAIALTGEDLERHRAEIAVQLRPEPANDGAPPPSRGARGWWRYGVTGGAVAAALAVAALLPEARQAAPDRVYATAMGEGRTIALDDGSRITLASASQLTVKGGDAPELTLTGAAYFDVPHRPDRKLVVHAGPLDIVDIGTRFAVTQGASATRVEVAHGSVSVRAAGLSTPVPMATGQSLVASTQNHRVMLGAIDPGAVGSWRQGQLRYAAAPLSLVADDLGRYTGKPVSVDPAIAERRFTGVLTIGDGSQLVQTLAAIMQVEPRETDKGIRLEARPGA